ncbi:MAG: 50S ribosomal protein L13 [Kosmotoga sp.]|nr:MAG: 50S ribosomal protein L13 [Kosmotoga sp.]
MKIQKTPLCKISTNWSKVQTKRKGEIDKVEYYVSDHNDEKIERKWYLVDATDAPLGRLAGQIARILMGKHKPIYTPHVDTGDFVVVVNASKIKLTGKKMNQKKYYSYTGYPGGLKTKTAKEMIEKHPEKVFKMAVRRMLPKTVLGKNMLRKLKVYAGPEHKHEAQKPEQIDLLK